MTGLTGTACTFTWVLNQQFKKKLF